MRAFDRARAFLSERLTSERRDESDVVLNRPRLIKLAIACAIIFLIATGIRSLHWDDNHLRGGLESLTSRYLTQARKMVDGNGLLFPRDDANTQMLVHPPGYSIFIAAVFTLFGDSKNTLTVAQIIMDGAAAVMVALIVSLSETGLCNP